MWVRIKRPLVDQTRGLAQCSGGETGKHRKVGLPASRRFAGSNPALGTIYRQVKYNLSLHACKVEFIPVKIILRVITQYKFFYLIVYPMNKSAGVKVLATLKLGASWI